MENTYSVNDATVTAVYTKRYKEGSINEFYI